MAGLSWAVIEKEVQLTNGGRIYLELAPVDPRSLMQGDYMRLSYAIAAPANAALNLSESTAASPRTGRLVLRVDEKGVGLFDRIDSPDRALGEGEVVLKFKHRKSFQIGAESFLFQEGTAGIFEQAKYGELSVDAEGAAVLIGLRDAQLNILGASQRLHQ
jgi:uncharacterized membrane-anchored protein